MPAIITNKFRIHMSEQFQESFSESAGNNYYLGIGRPQPYGTLTRPDGRTDNQGTDANPITPQIVLSKKLILMTTCWLPKELHLQMCLS